MEPRSGMYESKRRLTARTDVAGGFMNGHFKTAPEGNRLYLYILFRGCTTNGLSENN